MALAEMGLDLNGIGRNGFWPKWHWPSGYRPNWGLDQVVLDKMALDEMGLDEVAIDRLILMFSKEEQMHTSGLYLHFHFFWGGSQKFLLNKDNYFGCFYEGFFGLLGGVQPKYTGFAVYQAVTVVLQDFLNTVKNNVPANSVPLFAKCLSGLF